MRDRVLVYSLAELSNEEDCLECSAFLHNDRYGCVVLMTCLQKGMSASIWVSGVLGVYKLNFQLKDVIHIVLDA